MHLLLGADGLSGTRSGIGRLTAELAAALHAHPDVNEIRLLIGDAVADIGALAAEPRHGPPSPGPSALRRLLQHVPGARAARDGMVRRRLAAVAAALPASGGPAVYLEPNMIAKPFDGPTAVMMNDLSWLHLPESHPAERVAWIRRRMPATLRQAGRFAAISRFTAAAMSAELGIPPGRIDVVPLAPGAAFAPVPAAAAAPVLARYDLGDRGFILAVSTLEPRKNFDGLLAAWLALPAPGRLPLVVVGARGWGNVLDGPAARTALSGGGLRLPGHLPDAELAALYARCAAFAYPSRYEGFGLPILEAMAAGAPVVTSSTTACAETAGDAALLADPDDPAAITLALARVTGDSAFAESLRQRGAAHAAAFTWQNTAALALDCCRRALAA